MNRAPSPMAAALLDAYATGGVVDPPSGAGPFALEAAYEVGAEIASARLRAGWRPIGWKVGFTNRALWSRYGLDRPILGPVYRETVRHVAPDGDPPHTAVALGVRRAPMIEVEVVFGYRNSPESWSMPDWMAIGAELVDCHYEGWHLHPADAVVDHALHAGLVVGPPVPLDDASRPAAFADLSTLTATLSREGRLVSAGRGSAVLGNPASVLTELDGALAGPMGAYRLTAGSGTVVTTGTLTELVPAQPGIRYTVASNPLPGFAFSLT